MTDVRLTATNPDDSSVVPVACNAKGELKLEEPTLNSDDYVAKAGDNMTGSLTIGPEGGPAVTTLGDNGSAEFAGAVTVGDTPNTQTNTGAEVNPAGYFFARRGDTDSIFLGAGSTNAQANIAIYGNGQITGGGDLGTGGTNPGYSIAPSGSANFAGDLTLEDRTSTSGSSVVFRPQSANSSSGAYASINAEGVLSTYGTDIVFKVRGGSNGSDSSIQEIARFGYDGSAEFAGDVVIGSRNKKWMIVESGGIAHLVEQTRSAEAGPLEQYPELRNLPQELDLVEQALHDVMEKLRMKPPAGWPVWDGSDEN